MIVSYSESLPLLPHLMYTNTSPLHILFHYGLLKIDFFDCDWKDQNSSRHVHHLDNTD